MTDHAIQAYGYLARANDGHETYFKGDPTKSGFHGSEWRGLMEVVPLYTMPPTGGAVVQEVGPAYGIIDPDYARYYSIIRCTAWQYGYAIGMHGSFTRDLDLIAVPWTETACVGERLVQVICGRTDLTQHHKNPTTKPYGRLVFTLMLPAPSDPRWIDLSIMPRTPANDNTAPTHQPAPQASGKEGEAITLDNAPIGTKAPAINGGHWTRTARGWKWCNGATFPRPGGDWNGVLIGPPQQASAKVDVNPLTRCAANRDGECGHAQCPQLRDNEPRASGRHCPLDIREEDD